MFELKEQLLLLWSLPVYMAIILTELLFSYFHQHRIYKTKDTLTNIYLTILNFGFDAAIRVVAFGILIFFFSFHCYTFHNIYLYWIFCFVAEDFVYYWLHRIDHTCRFFWAVHVTHHSSEQFNLTVGFRSSVFQPLYRFIYFIPLVLVGFHPADILFVYAVTQIWGVLIHTQYINKLGIAEWIFSTPSHHRVHHASNTKYLDRNMGMFLIVWDKLFGTFEEEDEQYETIRFGLTKNIEAKNPAQFVFHEWKEIMKDVKTAPSLYAKWMYVFGPPGWSHNGSKKTSEQLRAEEIVFGKISSSENNEWTEMEVQ
ncbi:MAG: sterol desaturase family protein [Bacteroidota bacterium]